MACRGFATHLLAALRVGGGSVPGLLRPTLCCVLSIPGGLPSRGGGGARLLGPCARRAGSGVPCVLGRLGRLREAPGESQFYCQARCSGAGSSTLYVSA